MNYEKFNEIINDVKSLNETAGKDLEYTFDSVELCAEKRIIASSLKEQLDSFIKTCDEYLKENTEDATSWENKDFSKLLSLTYKKSTTIDPKIVDELTDGECRKGYTVTEKAIKLSGRKDLLDKYKSITESKAITLKSLVD